MEFTKNIRRTKTNIVFPKRTFVFDFYNKKNQYKGTYKVEYLIMIKKLFGKNYLDDLSFKDFKKLLSPIKQLRT